MLDQLKGMSFSYSAVLFATLNLLFLHVVLFGTLTVLRYFLVLVMLYSFFPLFLTRVVLNIDCMRCNSLFLSCRFYWLLVVAI